MRLLFPITASTQKFALSSLSRLVFSGILLCTLILALGGLVTSSNFREQRKSKIYGSQNAITKRSSILPSNERNDCTMVHEVQDKCAFVRSNCRDEEAGLFSYLSLYYCYLPNAPILVFIILSTWLALLFTTIGIAASEFFCINLSTISSILGMSESLAGTTFLAFGNGSPDVFSTFAAMTSHSGGLAIGELIGAAGFITAVVVGSMALVREFKVGKKTFVRDIGFFIVATIFTIIMLADGLLYFWECCVMVGFYILYVVIVVLWHWLLGMRRKRREREAAARGHYLAITNEEIAVVTETYDDDTSIPERRRRDTDTVDFNALEQRFVPEITAFEDETEEESSQAIRLAAEMSSNMRVTRPKGSRNNTITPIRPSLVGALEFRSVLSSFELKSKHVNSQLIYLDQYSDEPNPTNPYVDEDTSSVNHAKTLDSFFPEVRTMSPNNKPIVTAVEIKNTVAFSNTTIPDIGVAGATPTSRKGIDLLLDTKMCQSPFPSISYAPSPQSESSDNLNSALSRTSQRRETLAPPDASSTGGMFLTTNISNRSWNPTCPDLLKDSTKKPPHAARNSRGQFSSRDSSPSSKSPTLPFPTYIDPHHEYSNQNSTAPSFIFPQRDRSPQTPVVEYPQTCQNKLLSWRLHQSFPSLSILAHTLFPTLCTWRDKTIWEKFVSVVSAPSIFLLTITLPVVEQVLSETTITNNTNFDSFLESNNPSRNPKKRTTVSTLAPKNSSQLPEIERPIHKRAVDSRSLMCQNQLYRNHSYGPTGVDELTHQPLTSLYCASENLIGHLVQENTELDPTLTKNWNRWLVSLQIFTAPLFMVIILWANSADKNIFILIRMIFCSFIGSILTYLILFLYTSPNKEPKYRFLLCFLGFAVSIAWISTIANEVVGALKAVGVILGISDAILGLTIFAVGNSLGDLVADITVARLGYPIMALSACFGGPMLNILFGVGLSGIYMTVKESTTEDVGHVPYEIEISTTLMISAFTLLVTLLLLLVAVPLNGWIISRRIGWGLIILWSTSTVVNLIVEVSGIGKDSNREL